MDDGPVKRTLVSLLLISGACAGPDYHFDAGPTPAWTRAETGAKEGVIRSTGSAPCSLDVRRDADLATADAKNRIAQLFDSQVSSRSSDWTVAVNSGAGTNERVVSQQTVDVRSHVQVEDISVAQQYRDAEAKTQYVQVEVNRAAWTDKVQTRLDRGLAALQASIDASSAAVAKRHPLAGFKACLLGRVVGNGLQADAVVMDLLNPKAGAYDKLLALKKELEANQQRITGSFGYTLSVAGASGPVAEQVRAGVESFLKAQGLAPASGAKAARFMVNVGEQFVQVAQVANRQEQVHAATGDLKVYEPDGIEVPELAVHLGTTETESDVDAARAKSKALTLAADAIVSKFRSAFRKMLSPSE
jgi:hypothetical protein